MKKIISILMVLVTVFSLVTCTVFSASAATTAFKVLSDNSTYARVYILNSSGKTIPYTSKDLKTRGTVSYGKNNSSYIDNAADEIYLYSVGKNSNGKWYAYVSYPTSNGRVKAYIPLSAITSNNGSHKKTTSSGKFNCAYRSGKSASSNYYVAKGDTVYLVSTNGDNYQIMYPISNGKWRIAWCSKSNYNKYCLNNTTTKATTTTTASSSSKSYSVKNNVVTFKGVKLNEYPLGSKYSNSRYANVNGKQVDMYGWQCCGYVRYVQQKVYGCHYKNAPKHFPNMNGSENVRLNGSTSKLKDLITKAGIGAHLRVGEEQDRPHSMMIIDVTSKGFTILHANSDNKNTVKLDTYTWAQYINSGYGSRTIDYIEIYK